MSLEGREILVVDDEPFSRAIIHTLLREMGVGLIHQARNGADAAEILVTQGVIDCVICDFNMPVVNGLQLLKGIRIGFKGLPRATPVVLLTGNADTALVGAAVALDVNGFVVKPASRQALEARLLSVFAETFEPKPAATYAAVGLVRSTQTEATVAAQDAKLVPIAQIAEGAVLVKPFLIDGAVALPVGTHLGARMLNRLRDLATMKGADREAWVRA
ncbi:MAG: response regulator [Alphaproteobacteria bacterium]|nr:response regulator [Alphaproteobacteria bacterium]TAD90330.1 MAG: response regulator [Alphaproteobacteria bacterium]